MAARKNSTWTVGSTHILYRVQAKMSNTREVCHGKYIEFVTNIYSPNQV